MDNGSISRQEAIELVEMKKTKILELFTELIDDGLLGTEGKRRSSHYVLNKLANQKIKEISLF